MGIRTALCAGCIIALFSQCCRAQFQPYSGTLGFNPFGSFGFGDWDNEQEARPVYNTFNANSGTRAPNFTSRILSVLAGRWDGIENQVERRLETQPEHIAERGETRLEQASDNIERAREQQQQNQVANGGWGAFLSNRWNSMEDRVENQFDDVGDRIENTHGEHVADAVEDRWDDLDEVVEDRLDDVDDKLDDVFDDNDDRNDDLYDDHNDNHTDDWYDDVFDDNSRYDDSWNDVDNSWGNDNNDDWSNAWGVGNDDFWDF